MKNILVFLSFLGICADSGAQSAFSNHTSAGLEKVIQDYPNHFKNIKGEVLIENPQTTEYQCKVQMPGASCVITRYSSSKNEIYSWDCTLLRTEDFEAAKNKFSEIFGQIKNSIIRLHGERPYILNGQYESPDESKKFTSVVFELLPAVGEMKKLKVDLSLQYEVTEWKLSLSVYDTDRKDDEQGSINGD